jgi:vacuolar protein sorting-associated protein VTA1
MAAANFLEILKYFDKEIEGEILEKLKYSKFKAAEIAKLIKEGKVNREDGQISPISQGDASENANFDNNTGKQQDIQPSGQDSHPIDRLPSPPTINSNINDISSFPSILPTFQSDPNDFNILPTLPTNPILPTNNSDTIDLPSIPQHNPSSAPQSPFHQPPSAPQSPYNQVPAPPPPSHASPVNHSPYNMSSMYDSLPASQPPKMLDPKLLSQAEKCCRFAISSLQYDDLEEALKQLDKAKNLVVQLQQQK